MDECKKIVFSFNSSDEKSFAVIQKIIDKRKISMTQIMRDEALKAFELWDKKIDKVKY